MRSRSPEVMNPLHVAFGLRQACFLLGFLAAATWGLAQGERKSPGAPPLDLNTATVEQLQTLPEIGPATAKAIVRFREKSGPFHRVEDLLAIRGITKRKVEKLRPLVVVKPKPS